MASNIPAKKSLGQNFLRDPKILQKIVDFARIEPGDTVVEIGPGEGTLTRLLLDRAALVIAVEKDQRMVEILNDKYSQQITDNRLQLINTDILDWRLPTVNYNLVGNIPYYITGEVFRKFLESDNQPESITFVVQKEVAERIMARRLPAGRQGKESILSISIKVFGEPEFGGVIKAGSFVPAPKVDSAIISIRNINKEKFREGEMKRFFEILKKGFAHKRKLLKSNLGVTENIMEKCGVRPKARAEDLSIEKWLCLVSHF